MRRLGSVVTLLGGLLIAASFIAPAFGYTFPAFIPGFVFVFFGRVLRRTVQRREPIPTETASRPRPPTVRAPEPEPTSPTRRLDEILEEMGVEPDVAVDPSPGVLEDLLEPTDFESGQVLSSQEMIARAHRRWDRKED